MNVEVSVEEKLSFVVSKDGEIEKLELKGTVYLTINSPKFTNAVIALNKAKLPKGFKIKASPDTDRARWEESNALAPEEVGLLTLLGRGVPRRVETHCAYLSLLKH